MKISRTHSSFTLPTDAPACVKEAIDAFGFLVGRNTTLSLTEFAKLITDYSSHPRAKHIADELSAIDSDPEPEGFDIVAGGFSCSTETPSLRSTMHCKMKRAIASEPKKFIFNAFTEEDIIEHTNQELKNAGRRIRVKSVIRSRDNQILMRTTRGKSAVAILWSPQNQSLLGFRGIHQVRNRQRNYTFMFNGQAGKNLDELVFNGEQGKLYSTNLEQLSEYFTQMYCKSSDVETQVAKRIGWCVETNPDLNRAA